MRTAVRVVIVVVVVACVAGVVWMLFGRVAGEKVIGNAQVLGALAGVMAVVLAVVVLWPRGVRGAAGRRPVAPI